MMKWPVIYFAFVVLLTKLTVGQESSSPDDFRGFRGYLFDRPMQIFPHHFIMLTHESDSLNTYEVVLPEDERNFIHARIQRIIVNELHSKVKQIELHLDTDISDELLASFDHSYLVAGEEKANPCLLLNAKAILESEVKNQNLTPADIPPLSTRYHPYYHFSGQQTLITYGEVCQHEISWKSGSQWTLKSETADPQGRDSRMHIRVIEQPEILISEKMYYLILQTNE